MQMLEKKKKKEITYLEEGIWGKTPISILPFCTINELKSYIALASFQGSNKTCWPSLDEIASRSSLTPQATSEAISGLVQKGFVNRKRNFGKVNTYKVLIPTILPEIDDHPNDSDNSEIPDNSIHPDVDHQNGSDVSHPDSSDDIRKEHLKTKEEKKIELSSIYNLDEQPYKRVQKTITEFLIENKRGRCKEDGYNLQAVVDLCMSDDIEAEVKDMLLRFKNHPWWWEKYSPQPKRLVQAWDQLLAIEIPEWKKLGYGSEYEYNVRHKPQPSHHITMPELIENQTPKVEPQQIESFINDLEGMKN